MFVYLVNYKVLIDDEDYHKVMSQRWYPNRRKSGKRVYFLSHYLLENGEKKNIQLHRYIMNCHINDLSIIDHINGDTLDNRKCNLRKCTIAENSRNSMLSISNTSGYKGVSFFKQREKWKAEITLNSKTYHIKYCDDLVEAARFYDMFALYFYKEYARTNFSIDTYSKEEVDLVVTDIIERRKKSK